MSMESAAWSTLYRTISAQQERRPFSRLTGRRIAAFARPQRGALAAFVLLSIAGAFLAVATPLLAGDVCPAHPRLSAPRRVGLGAPSRAGARRVRARRPLQSPPCAPP